MRPLAIVGVISVGLVVFVWFASSGPLRVQNESGPVTAPNDTPDPVRAGEPVPQGFRQLLPRDAIPPVYNPTFVSAEETPWSEDVTVIGVELDGEAKAYPVSFLNRREMVNDWIAGSPVLVTW